MKLFMFLSVILLSATEGITQAPKKAESVSLNGTNIYYEVYGKGEPLFLLHGWTLSSKSWLSYLNDYTNDFEVYLVDLKGHGRSSSFKEMLSIRSAASDLDALIKYLKLDSINAIGNSYGGDVLFQLALLHPGLIKSMISIGACGTWNAKDYPRFLEEISYKNIDKLNWINEYQRDDEQVRLILEQTANYNVSLSEQDLKSIQAKVLFVLGDEDYMIPLDCISHARDNLTTSHLWILPNTDHGAHQGDNKKEFISVSKRFFKGTL